jgi:hypothetical protein
MLPDPGKKSYASMALCGLLCLGKEMLIKKSRCTSKRLNAYAAPWITIYLIIYKIHIT